MVWLRQNPLLVAVLGLSAAALGAQGWWLWSTTQRVQRAETTLRQRKEERDWLARQSPALTPQNSELIAADVAAAVQRIEELRRALAGRGRWLPDAPARTTDAYFALAAFAEKTRALAARLQVEVRADERFGFASYAHAGPEPDLIGAVHRQRVLVEHLVGVLLEARPRAILAVQREPALSDAQRAARRAAANAHADAAGAPAPGEPQDFFAPDPQVRLAVPGVVETEAFRLEFTGKTQALRAFLNKLAALEVPLIVRCVEVSALPTTAPAASSHAASGPLVPESFSKFAVMVEFIALPPASSATNP